VKKTTKENINKIIEFRQAIYEAGFIKRRDALFDLLDAIVVEGPVASFPMLSLSNVFKRKWPSAYDAVEEGQINQKWLANYLAQQVPQTGIQTYALDGTAWVRSRARTMEDRQYVYHPSTAINGGSVFIGYPYSLLDWVPEPHSSWSLSVDVQRIPSNRTDQEVGVEQVKALCKARKAYTEVLDIIAGDNKYGNAGFLRPLKDKRCGVTVRLRCDRVLYRAPEQPCVRKRGRPRIHGERFAFKEPETWGEPDEMIVLEDDHWGQVRLERWNNLHGKKDADVPFDVVRASVHLERDKPPRSIWFAWQSPPTIPAGIQVTAETIWRSYHHRWPVEPSIRFRKQKLGWTMPQFQIKEAGDCWSNLVALANWLLFLACPIVKDQPFPWQRSQKNFTPQRVQQSIRAIFEEFGSPTQASKLRGKSPGWPKGRQRTLKKRFPVVKKHPISTSVA